MAHGWTLPRWSSIFSSSFSCAFCQRRPLLVPSTPYTKTLYARKCTLKFYTITWYISLFIPRVERGETNSSTVAGSSPNRKAGRTDLLITAATRGHCCRTIPINIFFLFFHNELGMHVGYDNHPDENGDSG